MGIAAAAAIGTAAATAASSLSGVIGGSKGDPAGSITTTGSNRPFSADYSLPGLDRASYLFGSPDATRIFGGYGPGMSRDTTGAYDMIRGLATGGAGGGAVRNANLMLSGLIGDPSHSSSAYGRLVPWTGGDFSSSPGYSGLARTAAGAYLPMAVPGLTLPGPAGYASGAPSTGGLTMTSGSGNPFADAMYARMADQIQGRVNSSFNGAGRGGGGANQNVLVSNLGDVGTNFYGGLYNQERQLQQQAQNILGGAQGGAISTLGGAQTQAAGMTPALDAAQYLDPQALLGIGQVQDSAEANALRNYLGIVGLANAGSSTSSSSPYFTNPLAGMLGASMMGSPAIGKGLESAWNGIRGWGDTSPSAAASMPYASPVGTI